MMRADPSAFRHLQLCLHDPFPSHALHFPYQVLLLIQSLYIITSPYALSVDEYIGYSPPSSAFL